MSKDITVVSKDGNLLCPCSRRKALKLVNKEHAEWLDKDSIVLIMTREEKSRNKKIVLERDDYTCQYCGKKLNDNTATVDHVIPKSKGGNSYADNLVCSCKMCNRDKGNMMPEKYLKQIGG